MKGQYMAEKYLGIDVGGTELKYALMTEDEILEKDYIPTPKDSLDAFVEQIAQIYEKYKDQTKVIVMSAPGRINADTGFMFTSGLLGYANETNMADIIRERCGITEVAIENDGKCAGLAELWKGNLKDVRNGVIIGIGSGLAGGIVLGGKLYRGSNYSAGEFSLMSADFSRGYMNSLWAFSSNTRVLVESYAAAAGEDSAELDGRIFFDRLNSGDKTAETVLDDFCTKMVTGIMTLQAVLDADRFCIGGGISQQPVLIEKLNQKLDEIYAGDAAKYIPVQKPEITACRFHNDANMIGALYHYLYEVRK